MTITTTIWTWAAVTVVTFFGLMANAVMEMRQNRKRREHLDGLLDPRKDNEQ